MSGIKQENGAGNWLNIPKIYFMRPLDESGHPLPEVCIFKVVNIRVEDIRVEEYKVEIYMDGDMDIHTPSIWFKPREDTQSELKIGHYYVYIPSQADFYIEFEKKNFSIDYKDKKPLINLT